MTKDPVVAVAGATGAVGREMLRILAERDFPAKEIIPLASSRSAGSKIEYKDSKLIVQELTEDSFKGVDLAIFSAGGGTSEKYAPIAAKSGCVVVDNSSFWRMDPDVPLVVPEVNPEDLEKHQGIIANPNCSTIQMVVVLKPLHDVSRIKRVVVSTYQAVSGSGQKAVHELETQVKQLFNMEEVTPSVYPYQIAFNCIPHLDAFLDNGYTKEEMKMVNETVKIMGDESVKVTATTVRVPVFFGHSESLNVQTESRISREDARAILTQAPGIRVMDNPEEKIYPMPLFAAGKDETFVGRIREDQSTENALDMWVVADNIRKGAALNAVQIAEFLLVKDLVRVP
ncbi:aspartate-semialdehyde dehydrogenase [Desulfonatronospira thiodismutans ASO3-1]|uniref:Aspartate-semialdehyde dehydrogenase n=1 Tax=Desulfonatronospira thiodismutans ASO3-1 TaxID=555779 RepID=D6SNG7_9BACT|nr:MULTISPECIES: aspartate-semialdehyde dehydrogenase [Desulfonatronospira]EFI34293.1 aspartate-semialdehyde dehydrogenase [Desulfonatronospira thiodismutans ASO3-1]RQD76953.1 MAG: aspartate-semialdehyde dehydrogenase [Desulfonatronospira sp. MSAO_Bac3]